MSSIHLFKTVSALALIGATTVLAGCSAATDASNDEASGSSSTPDPAGRAPGKTEQELTSEFLTCGQDKAFPTWAAGGTTTVEFWNFGNRTVRLSYQATGGARVDLDLTSHATIQGSWWGSWLWITYRGWFGPTGYHPCANRGEVDYPQVLVQAY